MEPVKIDFIISGNTEAEGGKIEQSMEDIAAASKKAQAQAQAAVKEQVAVVKQIEADIKQIEKQLSMAAPGMAKNELMKELNAAKQVLGEEKGALEAVNISIENTAQKHTRLRTQVMEAKDALSQMEMAGKRGTAEYAAMSQKLGMLNDQMSDTASQAKILADDQKGFRAVASGVAGFAGAMSAAVGAASLFGAEQEDLVKIQTRLQAVMAITIGVQQVSETLNKDSYFSVVLLTKAKQGWASAQAFLNTQLGIGLGLSKAMMVSGIGLLIAGIGALILLYQNWAAEQKEINRIKNELQEIEKEAVKGIANEKVAVEQLLKVAGDHSKTLDTRRQAVERLNKLMPDYNGYINREGELVGNADLALRNYLVSLYKVEKAKKLIADIEKDSSSVDNLKATGSAELPGWKKLTLGLAKTITPSNYDQIADSFFKKQSDDWMGQIKTLESSKAKKETELQKLLDDPNVLKSVFGDKPVGGSSSAASAATEAAAAEIYDAEKALQEKLLSIRQQTNKLQIDVMKDGLEKRLAEIAAGADAEISKIDEMERDILDAYNRSDAGKKNPLTDISKVPGVDPKTLEAIEAEKLKITSAADRERTKAIEASNAEMIRLANAYADERTQIALQYEEDINRLEGGGQSGAASAARAERDARISEATAEMIMGTELYKTAADEKLQISAETTARLIEDIKKRIEAEVAAGNLSKEKAKQMLDELNSTGVSRQAGKNQNNPFASLLDGLKAYKKAKDDITRAKADGASPEDMAKLEGAANSALKATAGAAGMALQGVQSILGSVVDGLDQLGMLTADEKQTANEVIGMVGGAANIAMGIASGNPVAIIQGSVDLLVNAFKLFDKKSKDIEKAQKAAKKNLDDLARSYTNLQREVNKALGTDIYDKQRKSIENLKKQTLEYYRLIALEEQKKKKKQDKEAIADWKAKADAAKAEAEDILASIREELTQSDTKGFAGDLANALVSAFQQGEDSALAFGKVFDDVIRNAVLNAFKLKYLEKPIDEWLNNLGKYMEDGELQDWEKKALDAQKDAIYRDANARFGAISDFFGAGEAAGAKGIQGDVAKMTEETGSALTGQITAMRLNVVALLINSRNAGETLGKQLAALEEIKSNTAFCRRLDRIDETLFYVKQNGIKVL